MTQEKLDRGAALADAIKHETRRLENLEGVDFQKGLVESWDLNTLCNSISRLSPTRLHEIKIEIEAVIRSGVSAVKAEFEAL